MPGTYSGVITSRVSRRAVETCALTIMQRLDPSSETSVHDKPVHGGKSNSSSCGYCESHWIAAPREFMSKSITIIEPWMALPPEFLKRADGKFAGGVERAFMSTTKSAAVALDYSGGGSTKGSIMVIDFDMNSRGAERF